MMPASIRKNYLLLLSFLVYVLTLGLLLSEGDRQYYQVEKENIIKYNFRALFPHDTRELQALSTGILDAYRETQSLDADLVAQWRAAALGPVNGEGCVFRIRIVPKDGSQILEVRDEAKFKRLNCFENTLFYRDFQNVVSYEIADSAGKPWIGLLSLHYTTPQNYGPVRELTTRYRFMVLWVFLGVTGCYLFVLYHMILPTRHVISRIDAAASAAPTIVTRPFSVLERAYNDLARDAILMRVGQSIRQTSSENPGFGRSELLAQLPAVLVALIEYEGVLICNLSEDAPGQYTFSSVGEAGGAAPEVSEYCQREVFNTGRVGSLVHGRNVDLGPCVVCDISQDAQRPHMTLLVVSLPATKRKLDAETRAWYLDTVAKLGDEIQASLTGLDLHQQYVQRERSRANINLARNLGHDMTNIIATTRLDLRTITKIVELQRQEDPSGASEQTVMLADAVTGLGNNSRLLQEIVNIYRSFSYLNRPRFETVQLNDVVEEIVGLFALSLSKKMTLHRNYAEDLPECTVEPRLIKLALFNVLTNASDALKQTVDAAPGSGRVVVSTGCDAATGGVCITVRDNGPGIRNSMGEFANQAEVDSIFQYGSSTKTDGSGEGLGLSWVWTIVEDFHNGNIQARNHPDGGAEFCLSVGVTTGQDDTSRDE